MIDLVGVGNLYEEAATLCEMDPEFGQILVLERVWLDGLEVLGVKLRAWEWVFERFLVLKRLGHGVYKFARGRSLGFVDQKFGVPRDLGSTVELKSDL